MQRDPHQCKVSSIIQQKSDGSATVHSNTSKTWTRMYYDCRTGLFRVSINQNQQVIGLSVYLNVSEELLFIWKDRNTDILKTTINKQKSVLSFIEMHQQKLKYFFWIRSNWILAYHRQKQHNKRDFICHSPKANLQACWSNEINYVNIMNKYHHIETETQKTFF